MTNLKQRYREIKTRLWYKLLLHLHDDDSRYNMILVDTEKREERLKSSLSKGKNLSRDGWREKVENMTTPLPKRIYGHLDIDIEVDELGGYYRYRDGEEPHDNCRKCGSHFNRGDKVYLTPKLHDLDIIVPFPYCKNCIKQYRTAQQL